MYAESEAFPNKQVSVAQRPARGAVTITVHSKVAGSNPAGDGLNFFDITFMWRTCASSKLQNVSAKIPTKVSLCQMTPPIKAVPDE